MNKRFKIIAFIIFIPFLVGFIYSSYYLFGSDNNKLTEQDFTSINTIIEDFNIIEKSRRGTTIDRYYTFKFKGFKNSFKTILNSDDTKNIIPATIKELAIGDTVSIKVKKDLLTDAQQEDEILIYKLNSTYTQGWDLPIQDVYEEDFKKNLKAIIIPIFVGPILYLFLVLIAYKILKPVKE